MKPFAQFVKENLNGVQYDKIRGNLKWDIHSKDYSFDEKMSGNDWYCATFLVDGDPFIAFWSDSNPWLVYGYKDSTRGLEWAAVGIDALGNDAKNPDVVVSKVLMDFAEWRIENGHIPEMDRNCKYPDDAVKMAKEYLGD